jgi:hypothetical protein
MLTVIQDHRIGIAHARHATEVRLGLGHRNTLATFMDRLAADARNGSGAGAARSSDAPGVEPEDRAHGIAEMTILELLAAALARDDVAVQRVRDARSTRTLVAITDGVGAGAVRSVRALRPCTTAELDVLEYVVARRPARQSRDWDADALGPGAGERAGRRAGGASGRRGWMSRPLGRNNTS